MQFSETLSEHVKVALAAEWMEALRTRGFEVKKNAALVVERLLSLFRGCSCVVAVLTAV